jgi:hypothetical protein
MSAAAVIILRRKKFLRRFAELGATSEDTAVSFSEIGMRRSWIFNRMVSDGVFVGVGQDRFYMDEVAAGFFLRAQRRRVLVGTGVLLVVFVIVALVLARR